MKLPVLSWILCVLLLIGLIAWLGTDLMPGKAPADEYSKPLINADFILKNPAGKQVTDEDLRGHYSLIYFGFTHCPDICPTSLLLMQNAIAGLAQPGTVAPVFITLDPERDTPKVVGQYVRHFGPNMLGLTGSEQQIRHAADSFKIYYSKNEDPTSAAGYTIDHSGFLYLMGPDGQFVTHFPHTISEQALTDQLAAAIK